MLFVPFVLFVAKNERAQTTPSPLWKDRSGRQPGTALSINQFPINLSVAFQNAGPWLWARRDPAHASFRRAATWVRSVAGELANASGFVAIDCRLLPQNF